MGIACRGGDAQCVTGGWGGWGWEGARNSPERENTDGERLEDFRGLAQGVLLKECAVTVSMTV